MTLGYDCDGSVKTVRTVAGFWIEGGPNSSRTWRRCQCSGEGRFCARAHRSWGAGP